jgi:predicted nucleic acid-binding protein
MGGAAALWRSEWRNVLPRYLRRSELHQAGAVERVAAAEALVRGPAYLVEAGPVLEVARALCSAYDCEYMEYVALARQLGVPLLTSNRRILAAFADTAVSPMDFLG